MRKELLVAIAACIMAITVIVIVKKYLVHLSAATSDKEVILVLEFGAVVLVFASFVLSEFLRAFQFIFKLLQGKRAPKAKLQGMITLLVTVIVSMGIYISFARLAAHS
jgi:hypothetical protein